MGERLVRNEEVRGSIPLGSTNFPTELCPLRLWPGAIPVPVCYGCRRFPSGKVRSCPVIAMSCLRVSPAPPSPAACLPPFPARHRHRSENRPTSCRNRNSKRRRRNGPPRSGSRPAGKPRPSRQAEEPGPAVRRMARIRARIRVAKLNRHPAHGISITTLPSAPCSTASWAATTCSSGKRAAMRVCSQPAARMASSSSSAARRSAAVSS